jgi:threonine/homoserine/homoserine lactone efflux protein
MVIPDGASLAVFCAAAAVLLIMPGPAVFYIVARSVDQGRRAGLVSMLGIGAGTFFHVGAAAFGLSALVASSELVFEVIRYAGACYLVWMGIRRLLQRDDLGEGGASRRRDLAKIFRDGMLVNILNPKTALFFFAFLPQFVDPARGAVHSQVIFLGTLFILLGVVSDGAWALAAGTAGNWLKATPRAQAASRYVTGGAYLALGMGAALTGGYGEG